MASTPFRERPFPSPCDPSPSDGRPLSTSLSALARHKVLLIFCLLAAVVVIMQIKLVLDVGDEITAVRNVRQSNAAVAPKVTTLTQADLLTSFRSRMSLLLGIMIVCFGSMIYLYVQNILRPINRLTRVTKELSNGNLSVIIRSTDHGEVGQLAEVINDLAANYQEILLLTGTAVGKSSYAVERIEKALDPGNNWTGAEELREHIEVIKRDLEMLGSVVKEFEFYQTRFDGRKVVPTAKDRGGKR
ncbi:MAG: HAMP domain-containing protein [Desulfomonilaceae bacterium]